MRYILFILSFVLFGCKSYIEPVSKYSNEKADIYLSNGQYKIITKHNSRMPGYKTHSSGTFECRGDSVVMNSYFGLYRVEYLIDSIGNDGIIELSNDSKYSCETFRDVVLLINNDTLLLNCEKGGFDYSDIELKENNTLQYYKEVDGFNSGPSEISKNDLLNMNLLYKIKTNKSTLDIEMDDIIFVKQDGVLRFVSGEYYNYLNKDSLNFILNDYQFRDSSLPYDKFYSIR